MNQNGGGSSYHDLAHTYPVPPPPTQDEAARQAWLDEEKRKIRQAGKTLVEAMGWPAKDTPERAQLAELLEMAGVKPYERGKPPPEWNRGPDRR